MSLITRKSAALLVGGLTSLTTVAAIGSGALGAFTAGITNSTDIAGSGTLTLTETGGAGNVTCSSIDGPNNTYTCSSINKFGGNLAMSPYGTASTVTVTMKNTGTVAATQFTLTPGACAQSNNGTSMATPPSDFCGKVKVTITQAGATLYTGTAADLATKGAITLTNLAAGASTDYVFTTAIDQATDNTYQGLAISQPLSWTMTA